MDIKMYGTTWCGDCKRAKAFFERHDIEYDWFDTDTNEEFENYVNLNSVVWQTPETEYWKNFLKNLIKEHFQETKSETAKKILDNFEKEIKFFKQVCPKEMLDKLSNPVSLKNRISKAV